MFKTSNLLQVDRSHFAISFHLHMSSMTTLLYSTWCIKRPRDSLNQNKFTCPKPGHLLITGRTIDHHKMISEIRIDTEAGALKRT